MYVYNPVVFLCCLIFAASTESRRVRWRRNECEYGTYQHEGKTCCLCPIGSRVKNDCPASTSDCEPCEPDTYTDHPNNDRNCQPCKTCNSNANMDIKEGCSKYSNTVCKCKKNFYCSSGEQCRTCHPCETCKDHGVKEQCTETNNTVCNMESSAWTTPFYVLVPLILIIVAAGVVFYLWKTKKFCFKENKSTKAEIPKEVPQKDMNPYLSQIADVLGWKTMKRVAQRSSMRKVDIEAQEMNNPNDVKEQTYGLLDAWYQTQGLNNGYPCLIKTLHDINKKTTADEIRNIVEKEQTEA